MTKLRGVIVPVATPLDEAIFRTEEKNGTQ